MLFCIFAVIPPAESEAEINRLFSGLSGYNPVRERVGIPGERVCCSFNEERFGSSYWYAKRSTEHCTEKSSVFFFFIIYQFMFDIFKVMSWRKILRFLKKPLFRYVPWKLNLSYIHLLN